MTENPDSPRVSTFGLPPWCDCSRCRENRWQRHRRRQRALDAIAREAAR